MNQNLRWREMTFSSHFYPLSLRLSSFSTTTTHTQKAFFFSARKFLYILSKRSHTDLCLFSPLIHLEMTRLSIARIAQLESIILWVNSYCLNLQFSHTHNIPPPHTENAQEYQLEEGKILWIPNRIIMFPVTRKAKSWTISYDSKTDSWGLFLANLSCWFWTALLMEQEKVKCNLNLRGFFPFAESVNFRGNLQVGCGKC